jgi:branched-chain amino acid transport system substrate-binding protein
MGRQTVRVVAGVVCIALAGACSSDDPESTASSTTDAPGSAPSGPSGEAIRVGFVNLEGGAVSLPEIRAGAEVALEHVNTDLGGIDGRPLELVPCNLDLSPEKSIDCANQLVAADVAVVVLGIDTAIEASLPIYEAAGIPVVGNTPFTPGALQSESAFFLGASFYAAAAAPLRYEAEAGRSSVTYLLPESPVNRELAEGTLEPFADELDIDYRTVFYDPAAPDWNVIAATAMADGPEVIGSPGAIEHECTGFVGALRSAGFTGDVIAGQCSAFVGELGTTAAGSLVTTYRWLAGDAGAAPDDVQDEIQTYVDEMTEAGEEDRIDGYAAAWFAIVMDVAAVLGSIDGDIGTASVTDALRHVVDQPSFMGGPISCDRSINPDESVCSAGMLVYEVTEAGELRAASDDFVDVSDIFER